MNRIQEALVAETNYATASCAEGSFCSAVVNIGTTNAPTYQPISCAFHDLLESHATLGKPTQIHFRDAEGSVQVRSATITDVFAREGTEFLLMSTGEILRLDQLIEVDEAKLADY